MSLIFKGTRGEEIYCGINGPFADWVIMGETRISIQDFCAYAKTILMLKPEIVPIHKSHSIPFSEFRDVLVRDVITGGIFGWKIFPACVKEFAEEFPEFREELLKKHEQCRISNLENEYLFGQKN